MGCVRGTYNLTHSETRSSCCRPLSKVICHYSLTECVKLYVPLTHLLAGRPVTRSHIHPPPPKTRVGHHKMQGF